MSDNTGMFPSAEALFTYAQARMRAQEVSQRQTQAREEQRRQMEMMRRMNNPPVNELSAYLEAPSYAGAAVGNPPPTDAFMPVFRTRNDPTPEIKKSFKYHPAMDRYLVCHDNNTYRHPGNDLRPNMRYDMTQTEYNGIAAVKNDWTYIAKTERRVDREIVLGLAKKLWPNVEVEFSDEPAVFEPFSYERLIDRKTVNNAMTAVLWSELADTIKGEMHTIPEFDIFFEGFNSRADERNDRAKWREYINEFMVMDYTQRVLKETALDPYREIFLFIRSVGAFHFEGPFKLVIYDYPSEIHTSMEFGGKPVLHNTEGPAIKYAKSGVYVVEGFGFEERFFTNKESITIKEIEEETNQERRRIMTNLMGIGRYLQDTGAKVIQMDSVRVMTVGDDDRRMPRALIQAKDGRMFLCGTDGSTSRVYYMPVPREVTSCQMAHEAIAGPVGRRQVELDPTNSRGWRRPLNLGLDEKDCIAQS